jgi:hypothetical protein
MGFFKDIGRAFKKGVEAVADVGDKIAEGVGEAAGWVADKVGDCVEGVTRLADDEAADAVKKAFDNTIEPGIKRSVTGIAKIIATPLTALDDIAEKGLIDGIVHNTLEGTQDVVGGLTRTVGGQNAEAKFDIFYDEKIQPTLETAVGIAGRIALTVVPGGALLLAADAASEVGSLGYRVASGEKLSTQDYIGAALGIAGSAGAAIGAVTRTGLAVGSKVTTEATEAAAATTTKKATEAAAATTTKKATEAAAATTTKKATEAAAATTTKKATTESTESTIKDVVTDESTSAIEDQATSAIAKKIDKATPDQSFNVANNYPDTNTDTLALEYGDYAQPIFNSNALDTKTSFQPTV